MIRRTLQETEEFTARRHHPTPAEIYRSPLTHWRIVLSDVAMVLMTSVSFYTITAYTPTFGKEVLKLGQSDALLVTLCVGLSNLVWLPVMGALSDRIGRRPLVVIFAMLTLLTTYPAMHWLVQSPTFNKLLMVKLWISLIFAGYNGAMVVHLTEMVPAVMRTAGSTPAIVTYLIHTTGNRAIPGAWLSLAAAVAPIAVFMTHHSQPQTPLRRE